MNMMQIAVGLGMLSFGVLLYLLERRYAIHKQPSSRAWLLTSLLMIACMMLVNRLGEWFWNPVFAKNSVLQLSNDLPHLFAISIGYLVYSFIFYVTHWLRHRFDFLWRTLHQIHHSPQRIEVLTSFYTHPLETLVGALTLAFTSFYLLGLRTDAALCVGLLIGIETMLIHCNLPLPRWVGWFIQHPSVHRAHHESGVHAHNYGLPIFDRLFGTYYEPSAPVLRCGFESQAEPHLLQMLVFRIDNTAHLKAPIS